MNGQEWYDHIMEENPVFLKKFNGTDIWIHPESGRYVIGDGVPAHRRLMESIEKLGLQRGEIFLAASEHSHEYLDCASVIMISHEESWLNCQQASYIRSPRLSAHGAALLYFSKQIPIDASRPKCMR